MALNNNDITIIASRVQSLEGRLDDNIEKINNRLDLIVDLMQKVTALQEREISNAVQINDLKISIKETNQTIKEWNHHIHERMDRHYSDIKICREGIDASIENLSDDLRLEVKDISAKSQSTQDELAKWLNRGIGAWALASILIIVVQSAGAYMINGIIDNNSKHEARMDRMEARILEDERRLQDIYKFSRDKHTNVPPQP